MSILLSSVYIFTFLPTSLSCILFRHFFISLYFIHPFVVLTLPPLFLSLSLLLSRYFSSFLLCLFLLTFFSSFILSYFHLRLCLFLFFLLVDCFGSPFTSFSPPYFFIIALSCFSSCSSFTLFTFHLFLVLLFNYFRSFSFLFFYYLLFIFFF